MEKIEESIKKFLAVSDGDGYGSDYGDGYGSDYGDGSGCGSGYGYGYGYGDGCGSGSGYDSGDGYDSGYGYGSDYGDGSGCGDGSGIPEFNGQKVYQVDGVATLIDSVHGNYAKGHILNGDFTLTPCFIARVEDSFAHGETLRKAIEDATNKAMEQMPIEKRIEKFCTQWPDADTKIPARDLYDWHHILTGSCEMGRNQFARYHGIDIEKDSFTVKEFILLTKDSYGSDAIRKLAEAYGIKM